MSDSGPFQFRTYEDQAVNPENLTPLAWRNQAFAIKGMSLIYAREILFRLLLEADKRSLGAEVKDPLSPNTIKAALEALGGKP